MISEGTTSNTNLIPDIINNINDAENKLIQDGTEGLNKLEQAGEKAFEKGKAKIGEMKAKGLGVWNFLKKAGVTLGTALGAFAGLVAAGVIAVTLPVSLPVLGAIAGGLFLGGTIAALVHNIKDPSVKGAKNVIIQTLKDVGSGMLMAIPTLISFIKDPKQIGKLIDSFKSVAEDMKKDVEDLKSIATNAGGEILKNLKEKVNEFESRVSKLTKENAEEAIEGIKTLRENISKQITELKKIKSSDKNFKEKLSHLEENNEWSDKTLNKLNESFSGNSSKETDKTTNASSINIKEEVEEEKTDNILNDLNKTGNPFDDQNISTINKSEEGNGDLGQTTTNIAENLAHLFDKSKIGDNNNQKRLISENQNPENLFNNKETNSIENAKTENKVENQKEVVKLNDVKNQQEVVKNDLKVQLKNIQDAFNEAGLSDLKETVKDKVGNCSEDEEGSYNKILANIKKLEVFQMAIEDLKENARTPDTLNDIKKSALEAVQSLKDDAFVQEKINLDQLNNAIEALKTNDSTQEPQYKMSVQIGGYGWNSINFFSWNYERNISASLQFGTNTANLALKQLI